MVDDHYVAVVPPANKRKAKTPVNGRLAPAKEIGVTFIGVLFAGDPSIHRIF